MKMCCSLFQDVFPKEEFITWVNEGNKKKLVSWNSMEIKYLIKENENFSVFPFP